MSDQDPSSAIPGSRITGPSFFHAITLTVGQPGYPSQQKDSVEAASRVPGWLAPCKPRLNLIPANQASPVNTCNRPLNVGVWWHEKRSVLAIYTGTSCQNSCCLLVIAAQHNMELICWLCSPRLSQRTPNRVP